MDLSETHDHNSFENKELLEITFKQEFDNVLSRPITPENIHHYADEALSDVITIIENVIEQYDASTSNDTEEISRKEKEEAALSYFGLIGVESTLDYITDLIESINEIDPVILNAHESDKVFIPTDEGSLTLRPGQEGGSINREPVARTKSILFVLNKDYDLDLSNPDHVEITKGKSDDSMVRDASYYAIEAKPLNRVFFVCDEPGNLTFVFDSQKIAEMEVTTFELLDLTKSELKDKMKQDAALGTTIMYYPVSFMNRIKQTIDGPIEGIRPGNGPRAGSEHYLIPQAPEGYETIYGVSKIYGVTRERIQEATDALGQAIGLIQEYRGRRVLPHYSPQQIEMVGSYIEQHKEAWSQDAAIGYLSVNSIKKVLGLGNVNYIKDAAEALKLESKTLKRKTAYYRGEDLDAIRTHLEQHSSAFITAPPEAVSSSVMIANSIAGASRELVNICINEILADPIKLKEIGELKKYKFHGKPSYGFEPEQAQYIVEYVMARGSKSNASKFKTAK